MVQEEDLQDDDEYEDIHDDIRDARPLSLES